jgi:hypothetical protein
MYPVTYSMLGTGEIQILTHNNPYSSSNKENKYIPKLL